MQENQKPWFLTTDEIYYRMPDGKIAKTGRRACGWADFQIVARDVQESVWSHVFFLPGADDNPEIWLANFPDELDTVEKRIDRIVELFTNDNGHGKQERLTAIIARNDEGKSLMLDVVAESGARMASTTIFAEPELGRRPLLLDIHALKGHIGGKITEIEKEKEKKRA
ncbi:MAG: hypothetical protein ACP5T3_01845 [Candidatus Micrarchaeia archaeon]